MTDYKKITMYIHPTISEPPETRVFIFPQEDTNGILKMLKSQVIDFINNPEVTSIEFRRETFTDGEK